MMQRYTEKSTSRDENEKLSVDFFYEHLRLLYCVGCFACLRCLLDIDVLTGVSINFGTGG